MENKIKLEIEKILNETTKFDFPFLANQEEKKTIIIDKKAYIEELLKIIAPERFPCEKICNKIWEESLRFADEQFKSLSVKNKLNGFYLQELMHCYAKKLADMILDSF